MKQIIRIKADVNNTENRGTSERCNKSKTWFFEKKSTEMNKPLAELIKDKRERINK